MLDILSLNMMEHNFKHQIGFICVMLFLPVLCSSQDSFVCSRATYYGSPDCYANPSECRLLLIYTRAKFTIYSACDIAHYLKNYTNFFNILTVMLLFSLHLNLDHLTCAIFISNWLYSTLSIFYKCV